MNENIIVAITKLNEIVTDIDKDDTCFLDIKDTVEEVIALLKAKDINVPTKWVSVKDRLPAETHSIFWPWYGRKEWNNAMWLEQSDKVLVTVTFEDGTRLVTTGETHDGEWNTSISKTLNPIVTHWTPLPEPPKEDEE